MKKYIIFLLFNLMLGVSLLGQNIIVKGRVISAEDKAPLPGVSIIIKNEKGRGTVTDINGNYSINVPASSVLVFSYIGYVTQEIPVENRTTIDVVMEEKTKQLEEVLVVGYGEQKKISVTGAISSIKNEELKIASPTNITNAIAGRVPGVLARAGDGNLGGGDNISSTQSMDNASIFIRGKATVNDATPLILIDGVEQSTFGRLNPEDIEQMSILKDASATAVYGVKGANGVILITTKRGMLSKPVITFNSQIRMHKPMDFPHPLDAYNYAVLYNEALKNMGNPPKYTDEDIQHWQLGDDPVGHPYVDWYNELIKDHFFESQYLINIRGGSDLVKYYVSGEYDNAGGPFKASKRAESRYYKYNLRSNFDFNITKSTVLSVNLNGRLEDKFDANYGESTGERYYGSAWFAILANENNIAPVKWPNGTWAYGSSANWNTKAFVEDGGYLDRSTRTFDGIFNLKQDLKFITTGLSFRAMFGMNTSAGIRDVKGTERLVALWDYNVKTGKYTLRQPTPTFGYGVQLLPFFRREQLEVTLNYDKKFNNVHHLTAMATYNQMTTETNYVLPVSYRGFAGRITYDYGSKYLAEFNVGYNGSDQFAKGHRYALLPAFSLGWVLSEENFIKNNDNLKFIDFLKLRGSYGTAGNDKIGSYRYLYKYEFNPVSSAGWSEFNYEVYNFGITPTQQTGIVEGALGNDKVSWEISKKSNIGVDFTSFKQRINFTGDLFLEKRSNILVKRADVPLYTGLNSSMLPAQNSGKVTNKGIELSLSYTDKIGNVGFTIGGNYTYAHSNIDYIAELEKPLTPYSMQKDHPIGQTFGYVWTGKFYDSADLTDPSIPKPAGVLYPGDLRFEDINKDGIINSDDITAIGYPTIPEKVFGFNLSFSYKNVYLDTFWQGASNVSTWFNGELVYEFMKGSVLPFHLDRWVYDPDKGLDTRKTAKYPSLIIGASAQTKAMSTFRLHNTEYLRLKTLELGYTFPKQTIKNLGLSELKLFLDGSNLLTFDHMGNYEIDPEYMAGKRGNYFPQTMFYSLGINVVF